MKKWAKLVPIVVVLTILLTTVSCQGNVYVGVSSVGPWTGYPYGGYGYPYGGGVVVGYPFP